MCGFISKIVFLVRPSPFNFFAVTQMLARPFSLDLIINDVNLNLNLVLIWINYIEFFIFFITWVCICDTNYQTF